MQESYEEFSIALVRLIFTAVHRNSFRFEFISACKLSAIKLLLYLLLSEYAFYDGQPQATATIICNSKIKLCIGNKSC